MTADRVAALREVGSRQGSSHTTQEEFVARYRLRPAGTSAAPAIIRHLGRNSARQFPMAAGGTNSTAMPTPRASSPR